MKDCEILQNNCLKCVNKSVCSFCISHNNILIAPAPKCPLFNTLTNFYFSMERKIGEEINLEKIYKEIFDSEPNHVQDYDVYIQQANGGWEKRKTKLEIKGE